MWSNEFYFKLCNNKYVHVVSLKMYGYWADQVYLFIYLFIYGLFNNAFNSTDCVASNKRLINK